MIIYPRSDTCTRVLTCITEIHLVATCLGPATPVQVLDYIACATSEDGSKVLHICTNRQL
jgi:hypothetical protein